MIAVVLLFLLLFLFLNIKEGFQIWNKIAMDYPGNDLKGGKESLADCKKNCIMNAKCKGITVDYQDDGPGNCWMKTDMTNGTPADERWSYLLSRG